MSMRSILALSLSFVTIAVAVPAAGAADTSEEDAISSRAMAFAAAWNEHDAAAMAALWTEDGDFVNPFGRIARGRDEIEKLLAEDHAGIMKDTTYSLTLKWIQMVKPDVAIATWDGTVSGMKGPGNITLPALDHLVTVVALKEGDTWWTATVRASAPLQMAPPAAPSESKEE